MSITSQTIKALKAAKEEKKTITHRNALHGLCDRLTKQLLEIGHTEVYEDENGVKRTRAYCIAVQYLYN
jgi:glucosamine 6-phosphate synthetase-like amidotransferase/phosphosugar isomerase protein